MPESEIQESARTESVLAARPVATNVVGVSFLLELLALLVSVFFCSAFMRFRQLEMMCPNFLQYIHLRVSFFGSLGDEFCDDALCFFCGFDFA